MVSLQSRWLFLIIIARSFLRKLTSIIDIGSMADYLGPIQNSYFSISLLLTSNFLVLSVQYEEFLCTFLVLRYIKYHAIYTVYVVLFSWPDSAWYHLHNFLILKITNIGISTCDMDSMHLDERPERRSSMFEIIRLPLPSHTKFLPYGNLWDAI